MNSGKSKILRKPKGLKRRKRRKKKRKKRKGRGRKKNKKSRGKRSRWQSSSLNKKKMLPKSPKMIQTGF
jgi:hypothetical protein